MDLKYKNDFYITLPSNVSSELGENENLTSQYKTKLDIPLELKGNWYVGLAEITYPSAWSNQIIAKRCEYKIAQANILKPDIPPVIFEACLPEGSEIKHYTDQEMLISELNARRPQSFKGKFKINGRGYAQIEMFSGDVVVLSQYLSELLGFKKKKQFFSYGVKNEETGVYTITAESRPDLNVAKYNIFVYCDIISLRQVGRGRYPLLRSCPINFDNYGKNENISFQNIHYIKVAQNYITEITITLCDDYGDLVNFAWGKSSVTLHFIEK